MGKVWLIIWSLNADGAGAAMVDVLPSMEVCRQSMEYQRAHGAVADCALQGKADAILEKLRLNQCEEFNDHMFVCRGRAK